MNKFLDTLSAHPEVVAKVKALREAAAPNPGDGGAAAVAAVMANTASAKAALLTSRGDHTGALVAALSRGGGLGGIVTIEQDAGALADPVRHTPTHIGCCELGVHHPGSYGH
jgi:hypothetical protein